MVTTNKAFSHVNIGTLLAEQGWQDTHPVSFENFTLDETSVEYVQSMQLTFTGASIAKSI